MKVEGNDIKSVDLRKTAHHVLTKVLRDQVEIRAGSWRCLGRDVKVVPVVVNDDFRSGMHHSTDPMGNRRIHHVVRTYKVHPERHHRVRAHNGQVDDCIHALGGIAHLIRIRHIYLAELVVAPGRPRRPPPRRIPGCVTLQRRVWFGRRTDVTQAQRVPDLKRRNRRLGHRAARAIHHDLHRAPSPVPVDAVSSHAGEYPISW